jgi:hypothetical protein
MWAQAMLVSAVAAMGWWMLDAQNDPQGSERGVETARARATAESMATYRSAAVAFAHSHPAFEGELPADELPLPGWWRDAGEVHAWVEGRVVVVYLAGPGPKGLLSQMRQLSGGSILVGMSHRLTGTLQSPDEGDTGIPVPLSIPDGAPVWLGTRD